MAEKKYPTYTDVFSKKMCQLGETHPELVAVTAAMPDGTGVAAFGKDSRTVSSMWVLQKPML